MNSLNLPRDLQKQRGEEINQVFQKAIWQAVENNVDAIFIVGDLWESVSVSRDTVGATIELFASLPNMPIFIVPGRSDAFTLDSPYCSEFLQSIELPKFSRNVHIFETNQFVKLRHPIRHDVTITARSFGDEVVALTPLSDLKDSDAINLLFFAEPVRGYFRLEEEAPAVLDRAVDIEELVSHGFDYIGLGFGQDFSEVKDQEGRMVGAQSGALVAQQASPSPARLAVFASVERIAGLSAVKISVGDFEKRRIYAIASDISGLSPEDASIEIAQILEDEGARAKEDIAFVELEGRHDPQVSQRMIVEFLRKSYFYAQVIDNTRPDYLTQTFPETSLEARFIAAMLELKRNAEKDGGGVALPAIETNIEAGRRLSGRTVEDALYYGLDALRQKRVNLRHVD